MADYLQQERRTSAPTATGGRGGLQQGGWARLVNLALGIWLFISAFLWPHSAASRTNTWIVGLLAAAFSVWGMWMPVARFLNTALAVWLFFSTLAIFHLSSGTLWNNLIVALGLFIFSLVPGGSTRGVNRPPRYARA